MLDSEMNFGTFIYSLTWAMMVAQMMDDMKEGKILVEKFESKTEDKKLIFTTTFIKVD